LDQFSQSDNTPKPEARSPKPKDQRLHGQIMPVSRSMSRLKKITVLLVDDHAVVLRALCALLKAEGHIKVVGQARNGREAVKMAQTLRPDVILMDIAMPVLNGLQATRQILAANPAAKVLILSAHSDDAYIEGMITVGAVGYLEKQSSTAYLTKAINEVINGHRFFSPSIAKRMTKGKHWARNHDGLLKPNGARLTSQETEVVRLVAEGRGNKQLAAILGLTIKTVGRHRQSAMDKLNIHETADLTHYALAQGLIENGVQLKIV
jgi:DNA-binding NarL/FixJ family response regulator